MREVDGSIRYSIGSVPILITIECRERVAIQDVTWLEQLASKRAAIGAACTIAVSSSGFSKPALRAGQFLGIQTRLLVEIDDEAARVWASQMEISAARATHRIRGLRVDFVQNEQVNTASPVELADSVIAQLSADANSKVFERRDGTKVSILDLMRKEGLLSDDLTTSIQGVTFTVPPQSGLQVGGVSTNPLFDGLLANAGPELRSLTLTFEPDELLAESRAGLHPIRSLSVNFEVQLRVSPAIFGTVRSYSRQGTEISKVVQGSIRFEDGKEWRVTVSGPSDRH
jgi:hypothetical protein